MGSSYNACLLGGYWIEKIAKIPTVCSNSSEFRYREPVIEEGTLIIPVSQSGETADTLSASHLMKQSGYNQLSIVNAKEHERGSFRFEQKLREQIREIIKEQMNEAKMAQLQIPIKDKLKDI